MDASAIALARENNLPILVFSIHESGICLTLFPVPVDIQ